MRGPSQLVAWEVSGVASFMRLRVAHARPASQRSSGRCPGLRSWIMIWFRSFLSKPLWNCFKSQKFSLTTHEAWRLGFVHCLRVWWWVGLGADICEVVFQTKLEAGDADYILWVSWSQESSCFFLLLCKKIAQHLFLQTWFHVQSIRFEVEVPWLIE